MKTMIVWVRKNYGNKNEKYDDYTNDEMILNENS